MTNPLQIPDAAVQAALDEYYPAFIPSDSAHDDMRCALTAALPHLQLGFEVKKLEWEKTHSCNGILSAKTHFGTYFISSNKTVRLGLTTLSCPFQLLDEAKSFAQADFERRVRECVVAVDVENVRSFGNGGLCVSTGEYHGSPAVLIYPSKRIGMVGDNVPQDEQRGEGDLTDGELAFTFPTHEQAKAVADALCNAIAKPVDVAAVRRQAFEEAAKAAETVWPNIGALDIGHGSRIAAAIRALSAEPAQGEQWHDIATPPKDGTDVLLKRTMGRPEIVGGYFDGAWRSFDQPDKAITDVTHWMPLPAAPSSEVGR